MNNDKLVDKVCGVAGVPLGVLRSRRRTPAVVRARWVLIYCLRELQPWLSLAELAEEMGRVDHGTAIYGLRKAESLYGYDENFTRMVDAVLGEE